MVILIKNNTICQAKHQSSRPLRLHQQIFHQYPMYMSTISLHFYTDDTAQYVDILTISSPVNPFANAN